MTTINHHQNKKKQHHILHHHHHHRIFTSTITAISSLLIIILISILLVYYPPITIMLSSGTKFETVGMIPKQYFDQQTVIYGYTERIIDGDTIRVRHIPNYILRKYILQKFNHNIYLQCIQPLQQRGIANETLSIRLYAIDCPEISKNNKNQITQPFGIEAKEFTTQLCYHQIVKITLLRKDQYQRAVAVVEVMVQPNESTKNNYNILQRIIPIRRTKKKKKIKKDISIELAKAGLAELYIGGGAEYYHNYNTFIKAIQHAQQHQLGIWSIPSKHRQSAADYKKEQLNNNNNNNSINNKNKKKQMIQPNRGVGVNAYPIALSTTRTKSTSSSGSGTTTTSMIRQQQQQHQNIKLKQTSNQKTINTARNQKYHHTTPITTSTITTSSNQQRKNNNNNHNNNYITKTSSKQQQRRHHQSLEMAFTGLELIG